MPNFCHARNFKCGKNKIVAKKYFHSQLLVDGYFLKTIFFDVSDKPKEKKLGGFEVIKTGTFWMIHLMMKGI